MHTMLAFVKRKVRLEMLGETPDIMSLRRPSLFGGAGSRSTTLLRPENQEFRSQISFQAHGNTGFHQPVAGDS